MVGLVLIVANLVIHPVVHETTHCVDYWIHGADSTCTIRLQAHPRSFTHFDDAAATAVGTNLTSADWGHARFVYPVSVSFTMGVHVVLSLWMNNVGSSKKRTLVGEPGAANDTPDSPEI